MMDWFSPYDNSRKIGSVIDIKPTEALINLSEAGTGEFNWSFGQNLSKGEVNDLVFIDVGEISILGKITRTWLENSERLSVERKNSSIQNNPIGQVTFLSTVDPVSGKVSKGIKHHPKLCAQVYSAHPLLVALISENRDLSSEKALYLPIAELPHDDSITIHATPESLFSRHCAILGSTGGGKSYTVSNLVHQIQEHGGKVLLIDPTGEFSELQGNSYYVGEHPLADNTNKVTFPHWLFSDSDMRAFLKPSPQSQLPKMDEAIRSLKLINAINYYTQGNTTYTHNLTTDNQTITKAKKSKIDFFQQTTFFQNCLTPKSYWSFQNLGTQILKECIYPTDFNNESVYGGVAPNDEGYCLSLVSRINAYTQNPYLKWMIDPDQNLTNLPYLLENFVSNDDNLVRLDLSSVPFESNSREILVNAIGRELLSLARKGKISHTSPLIVFIDEAHQFLNKKLGEDTTSYLLDAFGNIAKEGRKYGLNIVIATQRPRDIPEDVLSQIGSLIVHRLSNQQDQDIVKKASGEMDSRTASFIPSLGQGEALLMGIDFPFPMYVKMKMPKYQPTSQSSSFSNAWNKTDNSQATP